MKMKMKNPVEIKYRLPPYQLHLLTLPPPLHVLLYYLHHQVSYNYPFRYCYC